MAVSLSIDLTDATFADLRALVDAARTAGVQDSAQVELEDTTLIVTSEDTSDRELERAGRADRRRRHPQRHRHSHGPSGAAPPQRMIVP